MVFGTLVSKRKRLTSRSTELRHASFILVERTAPLTWRPQVRTLGVSLAFHSAFSVGVTMTEYEISDYTATLMGNFLTALTVYFSVVTAYVVAAFAAGSRLSKTQLVIVNSCFTVAAGIIGLLTVLIFNRFFVFATLTPDPDGASQPVNVTVPLTILIIGVFVGCLVFMWDIRRREDDA